MSLFYFRKGCHLPEDDIFTVEIRVRIASIDKEINPKYKLRLGISNGGDVVSVGERDIQPKIPSLTANYYEYDYKPILDINMALSINKVFSRNEIITVEGLVEHMFKSKGESPATNIRFPKILYIQFFFHCFKQAYCEVLWAGRITN